MRNSGRGSDAGVSPAVRILERAIEVIESGGEVAIRTNTIAVECGVTAPILYRAFTNREGLVVAAQAERYRRASNIAVAYLSDRVAVASSRNDLRARVAEALDFIMSPARSQSRRLRAEVIGSAVSRPALAAEVRRVDREYSEVIAGTFVPAVDRGWVAPGVDIAAVALWVQGLVNGRTQIEFGADAEVTRKWDNLTREAVLRAIFGD